MLQTPVVPVPWKPEIPMQMRGVGWGPGWGGGGGQENTESLHLLATPHTAFLNLKNPAKPS